MIPRFKPSLGWQEIRASFMPPRRNDVENFEKKFASKMGQKHGVAFPYGRTGLMILLEALGIKNQEVICPAYTCVVVPHAIVYSGNIPVFMDSQATDFNMNLDLLPELINEKTAAIIATSIFGYPIDLDKLDKIRRDYPHLHILQDCAHSFAAEWKGRPVQREGTAAFFGLNISKLVTSVFGGMVTTDDDLLAQKVRQLRDRRLKKATLSKSVKRLFYLLAVYPVFWPPLFGLINWLERCGLLGRFVKYYDENIIDMPHDHLEKMSCIEARVGAVQLEKYDSIVSNRQKMAKFYSDQLAKIKELKLPPLVEGATYSHYVPMVDERFLVLKKARKVGLQVGELINYCIPEMAAYKCKCQGTPPSKVAMNMSNHTINLPSHLDYSKKVVRKIVNLWKT